MLTSPLFSYQILFFLSLCSLFSLFNAIGSVPKLLLISMDGMRYNHLDFFSKDKTKNFTFFIENGVKAKFIRNIFPSVTYPSHMTIVTGLYPESHGVVNNDFYDPYLEDTFRMGSMMQNFESKWFDVGAEPIWVTNFKAGSPRDAGVVMFPDAVADIMSYTPRIIPRAFSNNVTYDFRKRVDYIIDWFDNKKSNNIRPINLGILYFPVPDEFEHEYGTNSPEVGEQIYKLDSVLGYLKNRLMDSNLFDDMNIIITADHGHIDIKDFVRINLDDYVDAKNYIARTGVRTLVTFLEPSKETTSDDLYEFLKKIPHVHVYRKGSQALKDLHLNDNRRVPEFVLEAEKGYITGDTASLKNFTTLSTHGYDPAKVEDMHPFFIAYGPAFKKRFLSEAFDSVDIYPLMCHILGLKPAPNNGTIDNVKQLLVNPPPDLQPKFQYTAITFLIIVIFVAFVGGVYSIGAFRQGRIKQRKYAEVSRKVINHSDFGGKSLLKDYHEEEDDDDEL